MKKYVDTDTYHLTDLEYKAMLELYFNYYAAYLYLPGYIKNAFLNMLHQTKKG